MSDTPPGPYNPLAIPSIADSVVRELLARPCGPLPPPSRFMGAGIYALYYAGNFPDYAPLSQRNQSDCSVPIYVGKAVPRGGRRGLSVQVGARSQALYGRLVEHTESIKAATNLRLEDFRCRYLVVEELFIGLAERSLIQTFKPVWNAALDGFGNHDPGSKRYEGQRPGWDVLHPGRSWAEKMQPNAQSEDQWREKVRAYVTALLAGAVQDIPIVDEGDDDADGEER